MKNLSNKTKILSVKTTMLSVVFIAVVAFFVCFSVNLNKIVINDATIISTHENIFSKVDGEIFDVFVKENDSVNQGDLLIKIFPAKFEFALKKLESTKIQTKKEFFQAEKTLAKRSNELDLAKKDCDRYQSMFDENISTKNDFDRSINEMNNANSLYLAAKTEKENIEAKLFDIGNQILQAQTDLENTNVIATENGVVTSVFTQKNEKISKDKLLLSLNSNRIVVVIPNRKKSFSKITTGQSVIIKLKNNDTKIYGNVDRILMTEDFVKDENLMITDKCTILSIKTDKDYSGEIDGFHNIKMTINTKQ